MAELANVYSNVLEEYAASGLPNLRLLPSSGGIFSGRFTQELPTMTAEALSKGSGAFNWIEQGRVLHADAIVLCIIEESKLEAYQHVVDPDGCFFD